MMMMLSNVKFIFCVQYSISRRFCSALYITGDKASKTFAVVTPVIDFQEQLENKNILEKNFKARQLRLDVNEIEKRWRFFHDVDNQKKALELTRIKLGHLVGDLMKNKEKNKDEIEKYKLHSRFIKEDLSSIKEYFYDLEEEAMLLLLDLPNVLHEKTSSEVTVVHKFLENSEGTSPCHMEIAEKSKLIEYCNPFTCYLKSDGALFEMGVLNYLKNTFLDFGYIQFSNSDFCRSVVVEGCGINYDDKNKVFLLEKFDNTKDDVNRLHLCGSASLFSFMAYFTRYSVQQSHFPIKYFSIGKKYQPVSDVGSRNLFNLSQESVINVFTATLEEEDILEDLTRDISKMYESLGYHFRLVYIPANKLEKSESLRLSIQLYSNHLREYIEVGNISAYDGYLSKRLLFNYTENKERRYPKVIAGTVVNIPKLLGCVLENNFSQESDLITPLLHKFIFT